MHAHLHFVRLSSFFITLVLVLCGSTAQASASDQFGGPDGVSEELLHSYELKSSSDAPLSGIESYFGWKEQLNEEHGLSFGLHGYWLYQNASDTPNNEDEALGQIYRFLGSYKLFGEGTGHPGRLEWRVEYRSSLGGYLSPSQLGSENAAALDTAFAYSPAFDTDLSVLNWTQLFNDQTAGVAIGRLAFDVYLDAYPFQTISRGFLNRAFVVNPTLATTGIGALGAAVKGFVSNSVWLGAQMHDANAVSGDFDLDTVDQGEWLKAVEIGWTPSVSRRSTDRLQLTYWDKDARVQAGVSAGKGWLVSGSWQLEDWMPFVRLGHSDGGAGVSATDSVSTGFEYTTRPNQAWSFGLGWANPSATEKRDEYVVETSYKFQLFKGFSLLPNLQLLVDPANNLEEDRVWIFGLRGLLSI